MYINVAELTEKTGNYISEKNEMAIRATKTIIF